MNLPRACMTMKTAIIFLLLAALSWAGDFPSSLTYQSGATIHRTEFLRWQNDTTVVVKYQGGAAPVQLRHLSESSRAAVLAWRDSATSQAASATVQSAAPVTSNQPQRITITGAAFDKGFDEPYIFAGASVVVMDREEAERALDTFANTIDWPAAVAQTMTDARGEFELEAPPGEYLVKVEGRRTYRGVVARYVDYRWLEPITGSNRLTLTQDNAQLRMSGSVGWGEKGQGPARF